VRVEQVLIQIRIARTSARRRFIRLQRSRSADFLPMMIDGAVSWTHGQHPAGREVGALRNHRHELACRASGRRVAPQNC